MIFVAVSLFGSSNGYGKRPIVKVIGAKTGYDSDVLPYGVLQEILRLQMPKPKRKKIRPVTVKIYKDRDYNQYQIENSMQKKINYLRGVDNYFEFSKLKDDQDVFGDVYNGIDYNVLPNGGKHFMLVDNEGNDIVDLRYVKDKGIPRITKVEPIVIGNMLQEHVFLEVKK